MSLKYVFTRPISLTILLAYLVLALLYSTTVPAWEAPDEIGHYSFMKHLLLEGTLPQLELGVLGEAHQPPLYYGITAVFASPADISGPIGAYRHNEAFRVSSPSIALHGSAETFPYRQQALALHLGRLASVLMGLLTVAFTIGLGRLIWPQQPEFGYLAGGLVAFMPQFLFISSVMNNDNLLILAATAVFYHTVQALQAPEQKRRWLIIGIWLSVAILAKVSGLAVAGMVGLTLLVIAYRRRSMHLLVQASLIMGVVVLILTGWWFVRNHLLYGDPLGLTLYEQVFAHNQRDNLLNLAEFQRLFSKQFRSFWATFGWANLYPPDWFYTAVLLFLGMASLGGIYTVWRNRRRHPYWALGFLASVVLLQELYMLLVITRCDSSCFQGRYLLPIIGPLMLLISFGLLGWAPNRWRGVIAGGGVLLMGAAAVTMLTQVLQPAYAVPTVPRWRLWLLPHESDLTFGEQFALRGYVIEEGDTAVSVTLYWEALQTPDFNYSAFVHLIDEAGNLVGQKDHAPGEEIAFPPTSWQVGDIVADEHVVPLTSSLPSGSFQLRIGFYNWITGDPLAVYDGGAPVGTFAVLPDDIRHP